MHEHDHANKDLGLIAERNGVALQKADKARDAGTENVNTLFKFDMLDIFDDDPELLKLGGELSHIMNSNQNSTSKSDDDLADANRYCNMLIPWDFEAIIEEYKKRQAELNPVVVKHKTEAELLALQIQERRGTHGKGDDTEEGWEELNQEFEEWQEQYG